VHTTSSLQLVAERRSGLQTYLQKILACKDPRWRLAHGFQDFLAIPTNLPGSGSGANDSTADKLARHLPSSQPQGGSVRYTPSSWITEHNALQQLLRTVRASLLKRDALAGMGDAAASRSAGVEAKRSLKDLKSRLESLEVGLDDVDDLGQGERLRREGLLIILKDEVGNVDKMAEAGVRVAVNHSAATSMGRSGTPVNESDRKALLGGTSSRPPGRVLGAGASQAAQETTETRPLDDEGLLQLQQQQMDNQDGQLEQLSSILQRQLRLGQDIGKEIGEQNEMLDDLSSQVDRTGGKLGRAKRQMNRYVCRPALSSKRHRPNTIYL
jgi:regulator of vacuolar morphogenesis